MVVGHACVDVLPAITHPGPLTFEPGTLTVVGPVSISAGGCVPNTGLALHRLGLSVRLIGRVGSDPFGDILIKLLSDVEPGLAADLVVVPGEHTSYSIIVSPPGSDRMFLHFPGANESFAAEDVSDERLQDARILHIGYLPLLREMYDRGGSGLIRLLDRAKTAGMATSMDMSYPDLASYPSPVDWREVLAGTLPYVDFFLPSVDELHLMLEAEPAPRPIDPETVRRLAEEVMTLGAAVIGIKLGEHGFYLRSARDAVVVRSTSSVPIRVSEWSTRELWSTAFEADTVATTGAGDAAVAGFLLGLLRGMTPEETITAAAAVGASSVEQQETLGGVVGWEAIAARLSQGWPRTSANLGRGWKELNRGMWAGPGDRAPASRSAGPPRLLPRLR